MISAPDRGHTRDQLRADLRRLGLPRGATVFVHASLSRVRPARRDPVVVADALLDLLGDEGTLVVPAYTSWNSTTSPTFRAATEGITAEQRLDYQGALPVFDPLNSPAWQVGQFAERVRTHPKAVRSAHPQTSFAAVGAESADLMSGHELDCHLGERSPLGALHRRDAFVLMLGTEYSTTSAFHLAEHLYPTKPPRSYECHIAGETEGVSRWTSFVDIDYDDSDFHLLGADFERVTGQVRRGVVGEAESRLFRVRGAVEFAVDWMRENRASTIEAARNQRGYLPPNTMAVDFSSSPAIDPSCMAMPAGKTM